MPNNFAIAHDVPEDLINNVCEYLKIPMSEFSNEQIIQDSVRLNTLKSYQVPEKYLIFLRDHSDELSKAFAFLSIDSEFLRSYWLFIEINGEQYNTTFNDPKKLTFIKTADYIILDYSALAFPLYDALRLDNVFSLTAPTLLPLDRILADYIRYYKVYPLRVGYTVRMQFYIADYNSSTLSIYLEQLTDSQHPDIVVCIKYAHKYCCLEYTDTLGDSNNMAIHSVKKLQENIQLKLAVMHLKSFNRYPVFFMKFPVEIVDLIQTFII